VFLPFAVWPDRGRSFGSLGTTAAVVGEGSILQAGLIFPPDPECVERLQVKVPADGEAARSVHFAQEQGLNSVANVGFYEWLADIRSVGWSKAAGAGHHQAVVWLSH
jgi:hypothetical protein